MATELERLVVRLVGDTSRFNRNVQIAADTFNSSARQIENAARVIDVAVASMAATVGVIAVRQFAKFNKAMTESLAIMEVSQKQTQQMTSLALRLGSEGKQGPEELAGAYFFLASAGLTAEQSMASLAAVQRFATAGNFSLEKATRLAVGAQNTLKLASQDAETHMHNLTRVTDVLVKANRLSQATTEQFAQALTVRAGPTMRAYGKSIEEGTAALAVYAKQNIVGMEAGTFLRRTLLLLSKSAIENSDAHKALGFSVFDSFGKMRNLADIAENLEDITRGMSDQTRAATLQQLGFQFRIQQAVLPLIGMSSELRRFEKELKNAGGTTESVANKQLKAFSNQMLILVNNVKRSLIILGQSIAPLIKQVSQLVKEGFGPFIESLLVTVKAMKILAAVVRGVVLPPLSLLNTVLGEGISSTKFLAALLGALITVWISYRIAVMAVVAAKTILTALMGPKGWIVLAASIVVAAGAMKSYAAVVKKTTDAEKELAEEQKKKVGGQLAEVNKLAKGAGVGGVGGVGGGIGGTVPKSVVPNLAVLRRANKELEDNKEKLRAINHQLGNNTRRRQEAIKAGRFDRRAFGRITFKPSEATRKNLELTKSINDEFNTLRKRAASAKLANKQLQDQLAKGAEAFANQIARMKRADPLKPVEQFNDSMLIAQTAFASGQITLAQYVKEVMRLKKALNDATGETERIKEQKRALEDLKRQAERLTKSVRTPFEVLQDNLKKVKMLLSKGLITQETADRATKMFRKQFEEAEKDANKLKKALDMRDAVAFGSAEALRRIAAFRETTPSNKPIVSTSPQRRTEQQGKKTNDLLQKILNAVVLAAKKEQALQLLEEAGFDVR